MRTPSSRAPSPALESKGEMRWALLVLSSAMAAQRVRHSQHTSCSARPAYISPRMPDSTNTHIELTISCEESSSLWWLGKRGTTREVGTVKVELFNELEPILCSSIRELCINAQDSQRSYTNTMVEVLPRLQRLLLGRVLCGDDLLGSSSFGSLLRPQRARRDPDELLRAGMVGLLTRQGHVGSTLAVLLEAQRMQELTPCGQVVEGMEVLWEVMAQNTVSPPRRLFISHSAVLQSARTRMVKRSWING